ncbi:MAG: F0F1 ATP synthase subunit B [Pseudomonadota bacterium]
MAQTQQTTTQVGYADKKVDAGFPPFDSSTFSSQIVWLALSFFALYMFLSRIILPRLAMIIEQRQDRISRDLDEASRLKDDAEKALSSYDEALEEARQKAKAIMQSMRDDLQSEAETQKAELEKQIEKKLDEADTRINQSKQAALKHIHDIASDVTQVLVDKLVDIPITKKDLSEALNTPAKRAS